MEDSYLLAVSQLVSPMVLLFFHRAMDKMVEEDGLNDILPYLVNITFAGMDREEHDPNVLRFL